MTALNKIDALDDEERAAQRQVLEEVAGPVMLMSGVSREGLIDVLRAVRGEIQEDRLRRAPDEDTAWRP